jgi:hypothetical protein
MKIMHVFSKEPFMLCSQWLFPVRTPLSRVASAQSAPQAGDATLASSENVPPAEAFHVLLSPGAEAPEITREPEQQYARNTVINFNNNQSSYMVTNGLQVGTDGTLRQPSQLWS